ncbi:hypothetical protein [Myroides pelagicus]|uniref:Uncharacterized protein n=1 Tax=Myroides pelagicus TaxID=270914 RepID=A0A7K1GHE4_9FLAO|nr:hypothetical protein [Myroides pelagicus]MTH28421.1 hypothetical protein [Myroides pelagicus]
MSDLKISVVAEGNEVVVRQGAAAEIHQPGEVKVSNVTIGAVVEFLSKKDVEEGVILDSVLVYSYDRLTMDLSYGLSVKNTYLISSIIELNPDLEAFNINTGKRYSSFELADFIKMNRHLFESKSVAMELVSALKNIKANVNKAIEASRDDRGNKRALIDQVVESNIPEVFNIELPVFKGCGKVVVPIEVVLDESLDCMLLSPDLKQIVAEESKILIDNELDKVKEMHPQLRIYQK